MRKDIIITLVVGILLGAGGVAIFQSSLTLGGQLIDFGQKHHPDGAKFGKGDQFTIANDGSSSQATTTFNGLVTSSPTAVSTTTIGGNSATLRQADLLAWQYLTVNVNQAASFTYTLPASSTLNALLTNTGESAKWCFANATTAPLIDLVFVAGTGIDLETATGTSVLERIGASDSGCLTLQRKANTDLFARFESFDDSD